jgi:hypothetical protein
MTQAKRQIEFFDNDCIAEEQIPREFSVSFKEVSFEERSKIRVVFNDTIQLGDIINDNAHENDFYRYHDIFHYSFATLLGWSPCARAMMRKKRKSNNILDEIEDGARAAITEEAISMIIFNEAKRKNYFEGVTRVSRTTLKFIKEMTENFEVKIRTTKEWERAILKAYEVFRFLINNHGGKVEFNAVTREINYHSIN